MVLYVFLLFVFRFPPLLVIKKIYQRSSQTVDIKEITPAFTPVWGRRSGTYRCTFPDLQNV